MKNFKINFPCSSSIKGAYAMIDGKLTYVKAKGYTIDTEDQQLTVVCETPDGKDYEVKADQFYKQAEDYKKDKRVDTYARMFDDVLPGNTESSGDGHFCKTCWTMVNGEPQKVETRVRSKVVLDIDRNIVSGVEMPKEWYVSREYCIKWNDLTIVEEDGTRREQISVRRRLVITDEQRAAIDELRAAFEKVKAAGVLLGYNHDYYEWLALNITDYPDTRFEWSDSMNDEEKKVAIYCDDRSTREHYAVDLPHPGYITESEHYIVPVTKK